MSLAPFVQILGRGPGRSRNMTQDEARAAMALILSGEAAPEAVGAVLMLMRFRGENAEEIAGFVQAIRAQASPWQGPAPALDWPSYAAGRSRGLPWFLLAAKLVAQAGYPVLLHGWNTADGADRVRGALAGMGIAAAQSTAGAGSLLARDGIAYLPLEAASPEALRVLRLRDVLGLRSPMNTALRLFNPGRAAASVQGVFHPPYRGLQSDASALLAQPNQMVLKGAGGEFERAPSKAIALMGLRRGVPFEDTAPALIDATGRLADGPELTEPDALAALWQGRARDAYAEAIVTGTAAVALLTLGAADTIAQAQDAAQHLWTTRPLG
ncbi:glycosyl transferase family protein [Pararhodobacter zhoushanensis]|uniref:Glycosyl transferase family protein n=1 Tax=Pararhodobacter zhoushanensis TaxID=2479545 RepID=A0ABT3GWG5_9RHOB|nr:glycosyl transferase family protein [Pararhodobacter zhoushanensis]MCW1931845.1 glycosyl transferase family protein [Pararhodobacter zhoushanensis]